MSSIMVLEEALTLDVCRGIIERMRASRTGYRGLTADGVLNGNKSSVDIDISPSGEWADIDRILRCSLGVALQTYSEANPGFGAIVRLGCNGFRLRTYGVGDAFEWHIDGFDVDVAPRVLALVWYLSDCVGGETEFMNPGFKVAPVPGRLLMFPTSFEYIHRSAPVCEGSKRIAVGFIEHLSRAGRCG